MMMPDFAIAHPSHIAAVSKQDKPINLKKNKNENTTGNKTMMMPDFAIAHPSHIADVIGHSDPS